MLTPRQQERVEEHLPQADAVAARYAGRGVERDDLVQVARLALVKAAARFRPERGTAFGAYAEPTIRGEIKRYFRDHGWLVRPTRRVQELAARLRGERARLRQSLRREPTVSEVAAAVGVTTAEAGQAQAAAAGYEAVPLGDLDHAGPVEDHAHRSELRWALRQAVARLSPREREVVRLTFVEERSQRQVGRILGVSQMQVSRVLRSVVGRLRRELLGESVPRAG